MTDDLIIKLAAALLEVVKEADDEFGIGTPMGPCYAAFMAAGIPLSTFQIAVDHLVAEKQVRVVNHCLVRT